MPEIAAFVAKLREAFGDAAIDDVVRRGKAGKSDFYACEDGCAVGTFAARVEIGKFVIRAASARSRA
jgi:hypothetical protein